MNLFKLLLSVVIYICFVIPGIPCYLGVIYVLKKLYEHFKNLSSNVLISRDHHVEGLLHLANYLEDIESKLKNADEVYPTYLSGDDQWKKVR